MKKPNFSWTLTGGVIAGLAASLCCIGPLVALSLGLGSFAASAWFAQWRPVLLGVTFVLLGLAWYLTYRRPKADCADGSCARPPGTVVLAHISQQCNTNELAESATSGALLREGFTSVRVVQTFKSVPSEIVAV